MQTHLKQIPTIFTVLTIIMLESGTIINLRSDDDFETSTNLYRREFYREFHLCSRHRGIKENDFLYFFSMNVT